MTMQISKEELKDVLSELFNSTLNCPEHQTQHAWIQERIEAERARKEMFREITKVAIQWSVPVVLGGGWLWIQGHWK
jgi:tRNA A37 N6-isopentenylltransferase MiaA